MPIEYAPQSWNPLVGCRHTMAQCPVADQCWARSMAKRFHGGDFEPRFYPERLAEPFHWRKLRRVAVCFMGDLFGEWVEDRVIDRVLSVVKDGPRHTYLILTKNPKRLAEFNPWPKNAHVGISAWDSASYLRAAIVLHEVEAATRWISVEPMLGPIRGKLLPEWVVIGGLARGRQDPNLAQWVNDLAQECREAGVPYWEKNNLAAILGRPLRQDLPQVEGQ